MPALADITKFSGNLRGAADAAACVSDRLRSHSSVQALHSSDMATLAHQVGFSVSHAFFKFLTSDDEERLQPSVPDIMSTL